MPRKIALLIGVNKYGEGIPPLSAPANDVAAMKRVLENPEMGGFKVETLLDPDPILMQKEIKKLFTSCGKEDLVLLFFSGHGITDDGNKLYLATSITAKDDFDATAVPASFIQQQSKNSYTKRQVIVLDCCYSGAFAEGWQAKSVGVDLKKELGAEGRVVLTSSTATQTSFQQEGEELSLYTQYFLEGIETGAADEDEDGKIHAHELHQYAKTKVKEAKPKQEPGIIIDREGFNILLSQTPVSDPELEYRKLVEKYVSEGEISSYRRETLKLKQQEFLLTDEKADEIINSVLDPFRRHLVNLENYRKNYRQQIEKQYPLNKTLAQDIKDWGQQVLGLQDEEIAKIEQDVDAEKEAEQEQYNKKLQHTTKISPSSQLQSKSIPASSTTTAAKARFDLRFLPRKTRLFFGGGVALALTLTFSFSLRSRTPQPLSRLDRPAINTNVSKAINTNLPSPKFYFHYKFNPEPGIRKWYQLDDNLMWIEEYPSGHQTEYYVVDKIAKDGVAGVVARKRDGNKEKTGVSDFQIEVFIPDRESHSQSLYFRHRGHDEEGQDWKLLGEITYY